jgi:hypothetical protein
MTELERTAAGLQMVIPGCERQTLPRSVTHADANGQGVMPFYRPPTLRETLTHRAQTPLRPVRGQRPLPPGLFDGSR